MKKANFHHQIAFRVDEETAIFLKTKAYFEDKNINDVMREICAKEMERCPEICELIEEMKMVENHKKRMQKKLEDMRGGAYEKPICEKVEDQKKRTQKKLEDMRACDMEQLDFMETAVEHKPERKKVEKRNSKLFTVDDAAKKLHVAKSTMWSWIRDDKIGSVKIGGRRYICDDRLS